MDGCFCWYPGFRSQHRATRFLQSLLWAPMPGWATMKWQITSGRWEREENQKRADGGPCVTDVWRQQMKSESFRSLRGGERCGAERQHKSLYLCARESQGFSERVWTRQPGDCWSQSGWGSCMIDRWVLRHSLYMWSPLVLSPETVSRKHTKATWHSASPRSSRLEDTSQHKLKKAQTRVAASSLNQEPVCGGQRRNSRRQLWSAGTQRDKAAGKILKGRCGCSNVLTNSRKFPLNPVCWVFCSRRRKRSRRWKRSRRRRKKEAGLLA